MEETKRDYLAIIRKHGFGDDAYIDIKEENMILRECVDLGGVPLESAQAVLKEVCDERNYVLESEVRKKVAASLRAALGDDGKIDRAEFEEAVRVAIHAARGRIYEHESKRLVIDMIERGEAPVKTGFLSDWFKKAKREVEEAEEEAGG